MKESAVKKLNRTHRIVIAVLAVLGMALGWLADGYGHPWFALAGFAIPFFLFFIYVPMKDGMLKENSLNANGDAE